MNQLTRCCIFLLVGVASGCSSTSKGPVERNISVKEIENIPLEQSMSELRATLGSPSKIVNDEGEIIWIYLSPPNHYQRSAFVFDRQSSKLISKTVVLFESDYEINLESLLKDKFAGHSFKTVEFPQCGADFVQAEALYVEVRTGLTISFRKGMNEAESIGWTSPGRVEQAIRDVESCKGRRRDTKAKN